MPTVLPAMLSSLNESDVAAATGMYSVLRSFGFIWGADIPGIILNAPFDRFANRISDPQARQTLSHGRAYQFTSSTYIGSLVPSVREEVITVFLKALNFSWGVSITFGGLGVLLFFVEKHYAHLDTKFGIETRPEGEKPLSAGP